LYIGFCIQETSLLCLKKQRDEMHITHQLIALFCRELNSDIKNIHVFARYKMYKLHDCLVLFCFMNYIVCYSIFISPWKCTKVFLPEIHPTYTTGNFRNLILITTNTNLLHNHWLNVFSQKTIWILWIRRWVLNEISE